MESTASHQFDPSLTDPSFAVAEVLAQLSDGDATEITPLYEQGIDLDALDAIVVGPESIVDGDDAGIRSDGSGATNACVLFEFDEYLVGLDLIGGVVDVYR